MKIVLFDKWCSELLTLLHFEKSFYVALFSGSLRCNAVCAVLCLLQKCSVFVHQCDRLYLLFARATIRETGICLFVFLVKGIRCKLESKSRHSVRFVSCSSPILCQESNVCILGESSGLHAYHHCVARSKLSFEVLYISCGKYLPTYTKASFSLDTRTFSEVVVSR